MIQCELRIDEVAAVRYKPGDAVCVARLLVGREGENNVARGPESFLPQAYQRCEHDRIAVLHVRGAAAVIKAILLDEMEWVRAPVLTTGFDHIEMSHEKHRPSLARAVKPQYQVLLSWIIANDGDITVRKASGAQSLRDGFRGRGDAANGLGRVDLHELLVYVERERARLRIRHCVRARRCA